MGLPLSRRIPWGVGGDRQGHTHVGLCPLGRCRGSAVCYGGCDAFWGGREAAFPTPTSHLGPAPIQPQQEAAPWGNRKHRDPPAPLCMYVCVCVCGCMCPPLQADKRAHHNALERKRRDHIKDSFHSLRDSVPSLQGEKVRLWSAAARPTGTFLTSPSCSASSSCIHVAQL